MRSVLIEFNHSQFSESESAVGGGEGVDVVFHGDDGGGEGVFDDVGHEEVVRMMPEVEVDRARVEAEGGVEVDGHDVVNVFGEEVLADGFGALEGGDAGIG